MAKIKIPAKEVEVCDNPLCGSTGFLQTCIVCGDKYCLGCQGHVAASWHGPDLCRPCAHRDDVIALVQRYAKQMTPIFRKRDAALKRMKRKVLAERNAASKEETTEGKG
jgi:hypothetical protein